MKHKVFLAGMLAVLLTFGLVFVSCDNGSTSGPGTDNGDSIEKISYSGGGYTLSLYKGGNRAAYIPAAGGRYGTNNLSGTIISSEVILVGTDGRHTFSSSSTSGDYALSIHENRSRAAYVPATGDQYEIRNSAGNVVSSGTVTVGVDGRYTFSPFSGKPSFSGNLSPNAATFQITSTIILDNGSQLPGLSLSNTEDKGNEVPVYTSYAAAATAGYLFHNGQIDDSLGAKEVFDAFDALMETLDYTQLKINSNLPISADFRFDFSTIVNELNMQAHDYFKWDIQYNDHRILVECYGAGSIQGYILVNEVLILPAINGADYAAGTIKHVDFEYGVSDSSSIRDDTSGYDEFSINGKAPVDNLGLLQTIRIVDAIKTARGITLRAGDYITWKITYSDSKWEINLFIEIINPNGSIELWAGDQIKE